MSASGGNVPFISIENLDGFRTDQAVGPAVQLIFVKRQLVAVGIGSHLIESEQAPRPGFRSGPGDDGDLQTAG